MILIWNILGTSEWTNVTLHCNLISFFTLQVKREKWGSYDSNDTEKKYLESSYCSLFANEKSSMMNPFHSIKLPAIHFTTYSILFITLPSPLSQLQHFPTLPSPQFITHHHSPPNITQTRHHGNSCRTLSYSPPQNSLTFLNIPPPDIHKTLFPFLRVHCHHQLYWAKLHPNSNFPRV